MSNITRVCIYCDTEIFGHLNLKYCSNNCRKEMNRSRCRKYKQNNKLKIKQMSRDYYKNNKILILEKNKIYRELPKVSKKEVLRKRRWKKENRGVCNANLKVYRTRKIKACPKWLTKFDLDYIKHIYIQAKELEKIDGIKYHVDHIITRQNCFRASCSLEFTNINSN